MAAPIQHEQIPGPTAALSPSAYISRGDIPQRVRLIATHCQNRAEVQRELWGDFEGFRWSAEIYLRDFLDHLPKTHTENPGHTSEAQDVQVDEPVFRLHELDPEMPGYLEVLRLAVEGDIVAMKEYLYLLKPSPYFELIRPIFSAVSTVVVLTLLGRSFRRGAIAVAAASVAGLVGLNRFNSRKSFEAASIQAYADKLEDLLQRLQLNTVHERDLKNLKGEFGLANSLRGK
ncbi:hypothetical protein CSOJ01_15073 [Colletotrichum sojae]|uniref:Uncharacterized protein n=1 Tax=Colletotrichum sojae TaxID=2175907 RepID=A0A8H6INV0_9PEZI|nr:hypothetical protein CSOJ01_15073 [Colletotrichum sojae]